MKAGEEYEVDISIRFADLENLNDREDVNRAWEKISENYFG